MAIYVITEPCVGVKDGSCVDVCPVGCIHTTPDSSQYYIDPDICIECEQCEIVCPVDAIFNLDTLPDKFQNYVEINAQFFQANKSPTLPISTEEAETMVAAATRLAEEHGVTLNVTIVDNKGDLIIRVPVPSAALSEEEDVATGRARRASSVQLRTRGARPILGDLKIIGAIGVAGADEPIENLCCEAALLAFSREGF